jgi:cytochrome c oxidase assembly protein subunit 11
MRRNTLGNSLIGAALAAVILGMVGLSFAAVPLYRLFCQATGYAGTPDTTSGEAAPGGAAGAKTITVRFDANTSPSLPWEFRPDQAQVAVPLGRQELATYTARNRADTPVTGIATYNVTPEKVGRYFHKTACFCFDKQTLEAGQGMHFPLSFWVDPKIATDPDTQDVTTITLSYTFFRSLGDAARSGALASAGPHVGPRPDLPRTAATPEPAPRPAPLGRP